MGESESVGCVPQRRSAPALVGLVRVDRTSWGCPPPRGRSMGSVENPTCYVHVEDNACGAGSQGYLMSDSFRMFTVGQF